VIVKEMPVGGGSCEDPSAGAVFGIKGIGDCEFPPERVFTGLVIGCSGVDTGHDETNSSGDPTPEPPFSSL